jgi:hypothetical protein
MSCAITFYLATLLCLSNFSYEVLIAVLLSIQVLWDVTLCYRVSGSKCSNKCISFCSGHIGGHGKWVHYFPLECQEPDIQWHGGASQQACFTTNSIVNIFRLYMHVWWGNLRERDHWGDPGIDERIILRRQLKIVLPRLQQWCSVVVCFYCFVIVPV